jgi:signal transduction histidine kinase/ligand-binding sensor domain-containing protein
MHVLSWQKLVSAWLWLLAASSLRAQFPDYHIRIFDEMAGIRSHDMRKVVKDQRDFLWLLYTDRVLRYDGKQVTEFILPQGQRSLLCDSNNRIWTTSQNAVFRYENDQHGFTAVWKDTSGHMPLGSIFQMPGQSPWLETSKGFFAWNDAGKKFFPLADPLLKTSLPLQVGLCNYRNGCLAFATRDSIYLYVLKDRRKKSLAIAGCEKLHVLHPNRLFITTGNLRSFLYDVDRQSIVSLANQQPGGFLMISDVLCADKKYMLATSQGLLEYDDVSGTLRKLLLYHNGTPLGEDKNFYGLYKDDRQRVWISSFQGLIRLVPKEMQFGWERNGEAIPGRNWNNYVRNFAADNKGHLWMATEQGIARWHLKTGDIEHIPAVEKATDRMNHPSIRGLVFDGRHLIIGQTYKGVWLYDPLTKKYARPKYANDSVRYKSEDDFVNQIRTLKNGDHIIAARNAYLLDGQNYLLKEIPIPGKLGNVMFSYEDSKKRIWIATNINLYCFDSTFQFQFRVNNPLPDNSNWIRSMVEWKPDEFLVGCTNLYRLQLRSVNVRLEKDHSFFDGKRIVILYKDSLNRIWTGTENGFYCYDRSTGQIESFDQQDNVQSNSFYGNSFYRHSDGWLFLGGFRGVNYFYPERHALHTDTLQVWFTKVAMNGESNAVQFDFTAPYYAHPDKVRYRFRLAPSDTGWIDNGSNHSVRLSALEPGQYTFHVAASIDGNKWFESRQVFTFVILPPFWRTWWFAGLVVLLIGYFLFRWLQYWQTKVKAQQILNYFATSLYGQNTVEDVFWDIAKNCIGQLQFVDCVVYQYDPQRKVLVQKAAYGGKNPDRHEIINPIEIPLGKGIVGAVAATGNAEIVRNTLKDKRYIVDDCQRLSEITVPIFVDGEIFGVIDSEHPAKNYYRKYHLHILEEIAAISSVKISRYINQERLRAKISSDLHDEIGSTLTSINVLSKVALSKGEDNNELHPYLSRIRDYAAQTMESMSDIVWTINPRNDKLEAVISRMKEFAADVCEPQGIELQFNLPAGLETLAFNLVKRKNLFLVFKEAVSNAVKHSQCSLLDIHFSQTRNMFEMIIHDNGRGLDITNAGRGNGLHNMQARAAECDGHLNITSFPGEGTTIHFEMPIPNFGVAN